MPINPSSATGNPLRTFVAELLQLYQRASYVSLLKQQKNDNDKLIAALYNALELELAAIHG